MITSRNDHKAVIPHQQTEVCILINWMDLVKARILQPSFVDNAAIDIVFIINIVVHTYAGEAETDNNCFLF